MLLALQGIKGLGFRVQGSGFRLLLALEGMNYSHNVSALAQKRPTKAAKETYLSPDR